MDQPPIIIQLTPICEVWESEGCESTGLVTHDIPRIPNWQPKSLKLPFFLAAIILTLLHTTMCGFLIIFNYLGGPITFQAADAGAFFLWHFLPIIVAVLPGFMWEVVHIQVCRLQPYRDLASPEGSTLRDSLSQTYLISFSWFVPYHAFKHSMNHTAVAMTAITYLLSGAVLPTLTVAMIKIRWDDSITQATVQPLVPLVVLALVASMSTIVSAIIALSNLRRQRSGLYEDPGGIAGLGALIAESNLLLKFQSLCSVDTQKGIDKALGALQIGLGYTDSARQIVLLDPSQTVPEVPWNKWKHDVGEAHPIWLRGRTFFGLTILMFVPVTVSLAVMFNQTYEAILDNDPLKINGDDYLVKICSTVSAVINSAMITNWYHTVAVLQPYHTLASTGTSKGGLEGSSKAVSMDFIGSAVSNLPQLGQDPQVGLMALCAFLTQLTVIIQPAVSRNLGFIYALSWNPGTLNIPAGVAPLRAIVYVFQGIYYIVWSVVFVLVMKYKRKPFLPRKPYTLSSQILYLCHGTGLLQDLKEVYMTSKKVRDTRLQQSGQKYALGWIEDKVKDCWYVGIDRLENVGRVFRYPEQDSHQVSRQRLNRDAFLKLHPDDDEYKTRRDAQWPGHAQ